MIILHLWRINDNTKADDLLLIKRLKFNVTANYLQLIYSVSSILSGLDTGSISILFKLNIDI